MNGSAPRPFALACMLLLAAFPALPADLSGLTVESARARAKLRHDVDTFARSAIVLPHGQDETMQRWTYRQVCPLVAGLTQAQGEFVLGRISAIARHANVPLAGETCRVPNLFIIVTADAQGLLQRLASRPQAFNREASAAQLHHFIDTARPVRTWYNASTVGIDGNLLVEMLDTSSTRARPSGGVGGQQPVVQVLPSQYGSRLNASTVTHDFLSVIEVVDRRQVEGVNTGQLADYLAMLGLAQIDLDRDLGQVPSILNLFRADPAARPAGITAWDVSLLHALYIVKRSDSMAMADLQGAMFTDLSHAPP